LLAVATQVLNADPGASLQDIARAADIGRTTLHRYFPTRTDLMAAMTQRALDRLDAAFAQVDFGQPIALALQQLVTACLPLGAEMVVVGNSPDIWAGESGGRFSRYSVLLADAIEAAQQRGEVRASVPSWWGAELVMLNLWGGWYMVSGGYAAPKFMPTLIVETLMHGMGHAGPDNSEGRSP
jgi:AcrR family transcriptional regulator